METPLPSHMQILTTISDALVFLKNNRLIHSVVLAKSGTHRLELALARKNSNHKLRLGYGAKFGETKWIASQIDGRHAQAETIVSMFQMFYGK